MKFNKERENKRFAALGSIYTHRGKREREREKGI
jgi:hypothetical protein